ncbi:MAG: dihydrofolate reductase family protein [Candidatus Auribacterota bacterium]|nr:dihydrofolate reductase family protein [Candidatus Auribacterota bacterium]
MIEREIKPRSDNTLFLNISVDGKISSGEGDSRDPGWDWKRIHGVKEGLPQYYQIEQTTDLHSLITGKILAKLGANEREITEERPETSSFMNFIVIDRNPWLNAHGVQSVANGLKNLYLVTNSPSHPAHELEAEMDNLTVIHYREEIDFQDLFRRMYREHGAERITIQSGGTLNAVLLRAGLIDHLLIIVAPLLVGGKDTPTLIDGPSFRTEAELTGIKALRLTKCEALKDSYLRLEYDVIKESIIDPE